jgi:tryptophan-rich sensory protein
MRVSVTQALLALFPNAVSFAIVRLQGTDRGAACPPVRFQPPGLVFAIVWPLLYLLMGVALAALYSRNATSHALGVVALVFGLNLWWVAFGPQCRPVPASASILVLLAVACALVLSVLKVSPVAALSLAPLVLWLTFASFLSLSSIPAAAGRAST